MAKIQLQIRHNNNQPLKLKFATREETPGTSASDNLFAGTVDWGDGNGNQNNSSNELTHTYTSGDKLRNITVNAGWGENKYLAFPRQEFDYVDNKYCQSKMMHFSSNDSEFTCVLACKPLTPK